MNERRKIDWRGIGLFRIETGAALEERPTTKAQALADRRAALTELRETGKMTGVRFGDPAEPYTVDDIDWETFDLRFDLHLMAAPDAPAAELPKLVQSFDSPELATAAAKRYVKKNPGTRVEVTTAKREDT